MNKALERLQAQSPDERAKYVRIAVWGFASSEGLLGATAAAPRAAVPRQRFLPLPLTRGAVHGWKRSGRKMSEATMGGV